MKHVPKGVIGPNAVIRVAEALQTIEGGGTIERLFRLAGIDRYVTARPADMIDEREVTRLHATLQGRAGMSAAGSVARALAARRRTP